MRETSSKLSCKRNPRLSESVLDRISQVFHCSSVAIYNHLQAISFIMYIDGRNARYPSSETQSQAHFFLAFSNLVDNCYYYLLENYETMLDKLTALHDEINATYAVQEDMEHVLPTIATRSCLLLACGVKQAEVASCRFNEKMFISNCSSF